MSTDVDSEDYIGHKSCPKCGSKDNVYRYPDGHEFCFGRCGYVKMAPLTKNQICALLKEKSGDEHQVPDRLHSQIPEYANDAIPVTSFPTEGLTWLKKYGILNEEIKEHSILWSQSQQQLIFPIFNNEYDIIAWQARNFLTSAKKYVSFGKMDAILHIVGLTKHTNSDIILVEDLISAIKVSRNYRCMPLFGSGCSREKLTRLRRYTDSIKFWLDHDKFGESMRLSRVAAQLGFQTAVIHTEKDPKEIPDAEIRHLGS